MAKDESRLEEHLMLIETKLGGTEKAPPVTKDRLDWHLDYIESLISGGGSSISDVKVNDTSIVTDGIANLKTKSTYDPDTNKIVTENDLTSGVADVKVDDVSIVSGGEVNLKTKTAYNPETNKLATESDIPTGGGGVYRHRISFNSDKQLCEIYSSSSTALDFNAFKTLISTLGKTPAYGLQHKTNLEYLYNYVIVESNTVKFYGFLWNETQLKIFSTSVEVSSSNFTSDIVTEL